MATDFRAYQQTLKEQAPWREAHDRAWKKLTYRLLVGLAPFREMLRGAAGIKVR